MRRALKTNGEVPIYRAFDGQILFELGRFREAKRSLEIAVALDPESGHAVYHLALVLERLGADEEAADAFVKANALDPCHYPLPVEMDEVVLPAGGRRRLDNLPRSIREYVEDVPILVEDYPVSRPARRGEHLAADPGALPRSSQRPRPRSRSSRRTSRG